MGKLSSVYAGLSILSGRYIVRRIHFTVTAYVSSNESWRKAPNEKTVDSRLIDYVTLHKTELMPKLSRSNSVLPRPTVNLAWDSILAAVLPELHCTSRVYTSVDSTLALHGNYTDELAPLASAIGPSSSRIAFTGSIYSTFLTTKPAVFSEFAMRQLIQTFRKPDTIVKCVSILISENKELAERYSAFTKGLQSALYTRSARQLSIAFLKTVPDLYSEVYNILSDYSTVCPEMFSSMLADPLVIAGGISVEDVSSKITSDQRKYESII